MEVRNARFAFQSPACVPPIQHKCLKAVHRSKRQMSLLGLSRSMTTKMEERQSDEKIRQLDTDKINHAACLK